MPVHFGQGASFIRGADRSRRQVAFSSAVEIIGTSVRDTINPELAVNRELTIDGLTADRLFAEEDNVFAPADVVAIIVEDTDETEDSASGEEPTCTNNNSTDSNASAGAAVTDSNRSLQPPLRFPPRNSSLRWRTGPQPLARRADTPASTTQQNIPLTPPPGHTPPEFTGDNDDEIECFLLANPVPGYLDDVAPPRYDVYDPRAHDIDIILEDLFDSAAEWTRRRREAVVDAWNALTYNSPRGPRQLRQGGDRRSCKASRCLQIDED